MPQPLELPAVFPARVNGQQSMVIVTPVQIKWHPAVTEFSATRIDGGVINIADVIDVAVYDLGSNGVLRISTAELVARFHAAAELLDRVRRHVEQPPVAGDDGR
ncbi:MAG: hypothetical protein ACRD0P_14400 [Stackebrandtia sp.]